jgi:hypothetical protein
MTDVDISTEEEKESLMRFVDAFISGQGLELIVQNIARLGDTIPYIHTYIHAYIPCIHYHFF